MTEVDPFAGLAALGTESRLTAGTLLWQAGDAGEAAAYLVEGTLEVVSETEEGDLLVLRALQPGALLGEMSCLESSAHSATVRAATACRVRVIPSAVFREAVFSDAGLWQALLRMQSDRVRSLSRQVSTLAFDGVARRVARYLLERDAAVLRLTHQELAERVAATRESVTKALGALSRAGAVRLHRGVVEVVDREALRGLAE